LRDTQADKVRIKTRRAENGKRQKRIRADAIDEKKAIEIGRGSEIFRGETCLRSAGGIFIIPGTLRNQIMPKQLKAITRLRLFLPRN